MQLLKTQQECLLFSWEMLFKENKVIPCEVVTMVCFRQDGAPKVASLPVLSLV